MLIMDHNHDYDHNDDEASCLDDGRCWLMIIIMKMITMLKRADHDNDNDNHDHDDDDDNDEAACLE